jgi:hypothetical protein
MQATEIEDIVLQFLVTLPEDVQKAIVNHEVHLLETIDEESEYEIKEELWRLAKYAINMNRIITELKYRQPETEIETDSDQESVD